MMIKRITGILLIIIALAGLAAIMLSPKWWADYVKARSTDPSDQLWFLFFVASFGLLLVLSIVNFVQCVRAIVTIRKAIALWHRDSEALRLKDVSETPPPPPAFARTAC